MKQYKFDDSAMQEILNVLQVISTAEYLTREDTRSEAALGIETVNSMLALACDTLGRRIEVMDSSLTA